MFGQDIYANATMYKIVWENKKWKKKSALFRLCFLACWNLFIHSILDNLYINKQAYQYPFFKQLKNVPFFLGLFSGKKWPLIYFLFFAKEKKRKEEEKTFSVAISFDELRPWK